MAKEQTPSEKHVKELIAEVARREAERLALVQEFTKSSDPAATAETAKTAIKDMLPEAIIVMKDLMQNSGTDGVKAGLAKFVLATALDKTKLEDETDGAIKRLLEQLGAESTDVTRESRTPKDTSTTD